MTTRGTLPLRGLRRGAAAGAGRQAARFLGLALLRPLRCGGLLAAALLTVTALAPALALPAPAVRPKGLEWQQRVGDAGSRPFAPGLRPAPGGAGPAAEGGRTSLGALSWGRVALPDAGRERGDTATCFLVLLIVAIFLYERIPILGRGGYPLYSWRLQHYMGRFQPFQLLSSTLCHASYGHLAGNIFGLYIFGRAIEEQCGSSGLIVAYLVCGVFANVASLVFQRGHIASLGASGAVFGLFVAATLTKLSPDWRSLVEFYVLGQFAWSQLHMELTGPSRPGVDHSAHLAGALGGLLAYFIVRRRGRNSRE